MPQTGMWTNSKMLVHDQLQPVFMMFTPCAFCVPLLSACSVPVPCRVCRWAL